MATVAHAQAPSLAVHSPLVADRWIRRTTTASVLLLAGIAAVVSYGHMHALALQHDEGAWASALIPLSCDGMIIASSMALLSESRTGARGGFLPWALLIIGALASLAANIAVAEPTVIGRVIAAWPSFALTCSYELLMRQIRQSSTTRALPSTGPRPAEFAGPQVEEPASPSPLPLRQVASPVAVLTSDRRSDAGVVGGGRVVQRRAWQWALANRRPDGSLPTGTEVAREFRRSERWGRLVTNIGRAGQLDAGA
jgi:Protein of unknown function (DUF2637)